MSTNYPFIQPSSDIEYLFADAYLNFEDPTDYGVAVRPGCASDDSLVREPPYRVLWFYDSTQPTANTKPPWAPAPTHAADILIVDRKNRTVFDSTEATNFQTTTWHPTKTVYQWIHGQSVCRIVVHTSWPPTGLIPTPAAYKQHITPSDGTLDPIVVTKQPKRVKSLIFGLNTLQGEIDLSYGYNMSLILPGKIENDIDDENTLLDAVPVGGGRAGWRVKFDAAAGNGLGRFDPCSGNPVYIRTINDVEPTAYGDFMLRGEDCYWFSRPTETVTAALTSSQSSAAIRATPELERKVEITPATLQVHNDCVPCCSCDEFVAVKDDIDSAFGKWKFIANNAEKSRNIYSDVRQRLFDNKKCREAKTQRLAVEANVSGYVGIAYQFCNTSQTPIEDVCVNITVTGYHEGTQIAAPLNISIVPTTGEKSASCEGLRMKKVSPTLTLSPDGTAQVTEKWDKVDACAAASFTLMLKVDGALDGCCSSFRDGDSIKVAACICDTSQCVSQTIEIKGNANCPTDKSKYQLACICDPLSGTPKILSFDPSTRPDWGITILYEGNRYFPMEEWSKCTPPVAVDWSPDKCPPGVIINCCG